MLNFTEPRFVPKIHGLSVGNNLIKAHLDLGQIDAAKTILNELYPLERSDWNTQLSSWDTEIAKTTISRLEAEPMGPLEVGFLTVEVPVLLNPTSPNAPLFVPKVATEPVICLLGFSAEMSGDVKAGPQMPDLPGRFSRALPLFLAEQGDTSVCTPPDRCGR